MMHFLLLTVLPRLALGKAENKPLQPTSYRVLRKKETQTTRFTGTD